MSTSSKLTYLNTTKSNLKDVINISNVNITSDTTFRDYVEKVYDGFINIAKNKFTFLDNATKGISTGNITDSAGFPIYEDKMTKLSTQDSSILPEEYTQVDYIEATGTQYIDTGVVINNTIGYDITLKFNDYGGMFGRFVANEYKIICQYFTTQQSETALTYGASSDNSGNTTYHLYDSNIYLNKANYKLQNKKLSINGTQVHTFTSNISSSWDKTFWLFAQSGVMGKGRIYNAKLSKDGNIVRNFIPCFRNSDNEVGMYDIVNNVFYTNIGTGDFIAGNISVLPNIDYPTNINVIKTSVEITISDETNTNTETIPLGNNEIVGIGNNKDELIIDKIGHCYLNKKTAKIDSYNGETITTDYMSTTGGLDTGATVYYVLDTPQLIDLNYTADLTLYEGNNTITNSENMDMEIKYIKDSYE